MAHDDHNRTDDVDNSADTASFQRFVEREGTSGPSPADSGRRFRLLSLGIGAVLLVLLVVLLFQ